MTEITHPTPSYEAIARMSKDIKQAAGLMSEEEARFLVDAYYQMQRDRIRAGHQLRAISEAGEPHEIFPWLFEQSKTLEGQIQLALRNYAREQPLGRWCLAQCGIGPVITAGLLAHIRFEVGGQRVETASRIWRFAGLDPSVKWEKGKKRPWNRKLKVLCYVMGESFKKQSGRDNCFYGHLYRQRKDYEVERNEQGGNKEVAAAKLEQHPKHANREVLEKGLLPDGQLDLRATRWTVKLFLSHYHEVGFRLLYGEMPPACFAIARQGHADYIAPFHLEAAGL